MTRQIPPATDEAGVLAFESKIGARLPADYRAFLLETNGGVPTNRCFTFGKPGAFYSDSMVRYFLSISEELGISLSHKFEIYTAADRVPGNTLPIAVDPGGNLVLIGISGPETGKIYFWDHEVEGLEEDSASPRHLHLVAQTFSDFLSKLTPEHR